MRRLLCSLVLSLLCVIGAAQTAVVTRNVNLRPDASTDNDAIEALKPGAQLTLLDSAPTDGYYHVRVPDGQSGFVWGRNVKVHAGTPIPTPTSGGGGESPRPLVAKGHPVDWWFVFKFNSASFPKCAAGAARTCLFGGQVQSSWKSFSQQFAVASSDSKSLQAGSGCAGDTTDDPVGATFDEIYSGSLNYVVWNDQFYQDPKLTACGSNNSCSTPWGHSKGMIAWNDAGEGIVMQVTTPDWPGAGSKQHPRSEEGNTLGCTARDNDASATFPWVSPMSRPTPKINDGTRPLHIHLADGGYYDNSGVMSATQWLVAARRAIGRHPVLIVLIDATPGWPASGQTWSWQRQMVAPIEALLAVRTSSQQTRASYELNLARDYLRDEGLTVDVAHMFYPANQLTPLSWHLTNEQEKQITEAWSRRDPVFQSEKDTIDSMTMSAPVPE